MPILAAAVPAWSLPFATPTAFARYENPFQDSGSPAGVRPPRTATGAAVAARVPAAAASTRGLDLGAALRSIWLAGTIVGLAILLIGLLRLAWLATHAHRITRGRWYDPA